MPYQSIGDFLVNFMMNQFDLSDWYDNDESDLYESIDLIKDYYDDMTDRLWRRSPLLLCLRLAKNGGDIVVGRLESYRIYVLLYSTYVLLARPTKVRR